MTSNDASLLSATSSPGTGVTSTSMVTVSPDDGVKSSGISAVSIEPGSIVSIVASPASLPSTSAVTNTSDSVGVALVFDLDLEREVALGGRGDGGALGERDVAGLENRPADDESEPVHAAASACPRR